MTPARWTYLSVSLGLALAGCANGPGEPFGVIAARLSADLVVPDGRAAGDGWQRLDNDFQVQIERLVIEGQAIELLDAGGPALAFDPANPPAGYSLCHGGHCHADDGRLVSYEEIAAELAGGGGPVPVVRFSIGTIDVAGRTERELECEPGCDLPRAEVGIVRFPVTGLEASGLVRDGRAEQRIAGEIAWTLELDREEVPVHLFDRDIGLSIDRGEDPAIDLTIRLRVSAALLDGIAWSELLVDRRTIQLDADPAAAESVAQALGEIPLDSAAERGPL
jgi:hypothetical protein